MPIYQLGKCIPKFINLAESWIAPNAVVLGRVVIEPSTSIWFGAVLRADNNDIYIGEGTNIQDNVVIHVDEKYSATIGKNCTIGHSANLHGCHIAHNSLIGMGAIIMNGAIIGEDSLVGAGSLVPEKKVFPNGALILGAPAKFVRFLSDGEKDEIRKATNDYKAKISLYRQSLRELV